MLVKTVQQSGANTRNTLDCDQSNYSLCIVFSYIPMEFGPTENNTNRSAEPKDHTIEPTQVNRMIRCGDMAVRIFPNERSVGWLSPSSVANIYLH